LHVKWKRRECLSKESYICKADIKLETKILPIGQKQVEFTQKVLMALKNEL